MNKQPDHIDETVLLRFSQGLTTEAETASVNEWLLTSENQVQYDNWLRIWQTADAVENFDLIDVDKNWREFESRLNSIKHHKRTVWLKFAASLLAIALIAFLFEQLTSEDTEKYLKYNAQTDEKLILPDQTKVWLKEGSSLEYPEEFTSNARSVVLLGEALFEVEHDAEHPFIVQAGETSTEVLGTKFNLRTADQNGFLELVLLEGSVRFNTPQEQVVLVPGQKVSVDSNGLITKTLNSNPNFMSWQTGNFVFLNTPMQQVMSDLGNAYGFTFEFEESTFAGCPLTSKYEQEPLEDIFQVLEALFNAKFQQTNNQVKIIGGQCK